MFDDIGSKMKTLATVCTWLGIAGSVLLGILMLNNTPLGLLVIIFGCFFSWCASLGLYGFGHLIENSDKLVAQKDGGDPTARTKITAPTNVTRVADYAFEYSNDLTDFVIPSTVTSIGRSAFYGCRKLSNITIPQSVTSIGYEAFCSCKNLTSITYNGTMEEWKAIKKDGHWNALTGNYTIHCTDGDISKADS